MKETKFKQTEVGMIPSDWEVKKLGSISFVTKLAGFEFTSHVRYSDDGKIIALRGLNVRKGQLLLDDVKYIDNSNFSKLNRSKLFKKDLLFTYVGTVGNAALVDKNNTYYLAPNVALIRIDEKNSPEYLMHLILSDYFFNNQIKTLMSTTSQAALSMTNIRLFLISLPPTIEEQQRIANALSDVDTLINNLEKLIAKKKNIKQGAMQQLLTGKKRLPGFAPAKPTYKQTELGKIPTDWEVKKIGEFTKLQAGGTPSTLCDEFWGGNIRWMNSGELNNKRIYDVAGRITELGLNSSSTHLIPSNCVLVGLAGQGKTRGTAAINYVELCTNQSIAAMFPSKTHNSEYLYHNIDSRYEELRDLSSGDGGRGGLNLRILANLFIALPSIEEQTAIANVLSDMDTEIATLETKLAKYRKLKTGMMQQLLTGKIRLV